MTDDDKDNRKYYNRVHFFDNGCLDYEDFLDEIDDDNDDNDDLMISENF